MKKKISLILISMIASSLYAADDAKALFYKAFTHGDKKAKSQLETKFPKSEYVEVFKVYDAIPDHFDAEKTPAALRLADALVDRAPQFDVGYFIRATLYFDLSTHDENAEKSHAQSMAQNVEKAISLGLMNNLPPSAKPLLFSLRCYGDYIASNYESALKHCDTGLKIDSSDEVLHRYRALTLYMMQDYAGAVKSFDVALKKDGKNTYLLNLRGLAKLQSQDFKGALADATAGKKIDANIVEFVILSGRAKVALNKRKDGCVELRSAAAMGQGADAQAWLNELCQ